MKHLSYIFLIPALIFVQGCGNENGKSDAYGNFEADDYIISSQVQGIVKTFLLQEGDKPAKNQVVGYIDSTQLHLKTEQLKAQKQTILSKTDNLQAEIKVLEEQKETLVTEKKRVENLLKENAIPRKQLDDVKGQLDVITSRVNAIKTQKRNIHNEAAVIQAQILQMEDQLSNCLIKNPEEGRVLETYIKKNELAMPGKPLYKIADAGKIYLRAYISGAQLAHVKVGQEAEVIFDLDKSENQTITGKVTWISEEAEFTPKIIQTKEERVNLVYAVKILVTNDGRIKIGMPGEVNFK